MALPPGEGMTDTYRILLVRPDGLGDLILSLPAARTLKESFPGCEVHYFISIRASGIRSLVSYVDGWLVDDGGDGSRLSLRQLVLKIRTADYSHVIELKPSWRTALAAFLAGVKIRIGTSRRIYSPLYNRTISVHRKGSGSHQTDLDLRLLKPLGIDVEGILPALRITENARQGAAELFRTINKEYVVIHPGSSGSAPNWPVENYRKLAGIILAETDYDVVITDRHKIDDEFAGCLDVSGKTDIETLAGILKGASLFVSGSTGPLHLADSLGVRCVSFFLNRPDIGPARWGPMRNMKSIITPVDDCHCRNLKSCRCLERISPGEAFKRIERILSCKNNAGVGQ
jgi:ADP-heptose:LPS heptosyltransferase